MGIKIKDILCYCNWIAYMQTHNVRDVEDKEVRKMQKCGEESSGYSVYECEMCEEIRFVPFTCKSRICTKCGKKHADNWAYNVNMRMLDDTIHRNLVFTVSDRLWILLEEDFGSRKVLLDSAYQTMKEVMGKDITPGVISALHSYGKDMKFNAHVHMIVTEGGLTKNKQWIKIPFFPYEKLRKVWQYNILTNLKRYFKGKKINKKYVQKILLDDFSDIANEGEEEIDIDKLIDTLFKDYENGFYVRAKDRITRPYEAIRYIGRYLRHPAIAESRIVEYSPLDKENKVVFFYEDDKKEKHYVTMTVFEFIEALIKHIPEPNFKMVRWYGIYSRPLWRKVKATLCFMGRYNVKKEEYFKKRMKNSFAIRCKICGCVMRKISDSFKWEHG